MDNKQELSLDQLTSHHLVHDGVPPLHSANLIPNKEHDAVAQTISVTTECISRLYGGLMLLGKPFASRLNEDNPETAVVYETAIMTQFIPAFALSFPDFAEFSVKVNPNGALIGQNDFTNTILNFMVALATAPIDQGNKIDPALIYCPSLPNEVWTHNQLMNAFDHDEDEEDLDHDYSTTRSIKTDSY